MVGFGGDAGYPLGVGTRPPPNPTINTVEEYNELDPESSLYAIGIALCLVLLAFTAADDTALMAITRHRLSIMQEESATRATVITRLLADPYRFKAAILLLNTATVIAATAFTLRVTDGLV